MKRNACIFLLIVLSAAVLQAQQLTEERLIQGAWGPEDNGAMSFTLKFESGGMFSVYPPGPSHGNSTHGTYRITGNSVVLTPQVDGFKFFDGASSWTLKYGISNNSIFATDYLFPGDKSANRQFWNARTAPVGQTRGIGGAEAVIIQECMAVCSVDLSIRDLPGTQGRRYTYVDPMHGELGWLPQGTEVRVIARSKTRENIDGLNSYWYFVLLKEYWDETPYLKGNPELQGGWMFGGYLSMGK